MLAPRVLFNGLSDIELATEVGTRLIAARKNHYCISDVDAPAPVESDFRACAPVTSESIASGGAMLLGLCPSSFGWKAKKYLAGRYDDADPKLNKALSLLLSHYGEKAVNERFRTLVRGTTTLIGCASRRTQRVHESLGLGTTPIGGAIGAIDCHIGGNPNCCSETAACIRYHPTDSGDFQFSALSRKDVITMNGQRITPDMGSFPLFNEDICTVGPRVFVFLLPTDT